MPDTERHKPFCSNCGQWQYETSFGYLDCLNDCAEHGLTERKPCDWNDESKALIVNDGATRS